MEYFLQDEENFDNQLVLIEIFHQEFINSRNRLKKEIRYEKIAVFKNRRF